MEGYIGEIRIFGGSYAPSNWLFCQGQSLSISGSTNGDSNDVLYSIIGNTYGGDGRTTFSLPNLQGSSPAEVTSGSLTFGQYIICYAGTYPTRD